MLHFIFTMLFYGAFLACMLILCMWFFLGMTVQQSINWIIQKVSNAGTEVVTQVDKAADTVEYTVENTVRKLQ